LAVALSIGCAVACGDDDDDGPGGSAGSSGKGGTGGTAGSGGKGGSGGTAGEGGSMAGQGGGGGSIGGAGGEGGLGGASACVDGEDCPQLDYCGPYALNELCTNARPCPSLRELQNRGCNGEFEQLTQQATTCGTVVVLSFGLGSTEYGFNEAGTRRSVLNHSDAIGVCKEGNGISSSTLYGAVPCEPVGEVTDLCGDGGAGGAGGAGGGAGGAP
jgi:hypothetical protein